MNNILSLLNTSAEYAEIKSALKRGKTPVALTGCVDSEKCHFVAGLCEDYRVRLIVTYNDLKAREIYEDMSFYDKNVFLYPAKDLIFYSADIKGNAIVRDRIATIRQLMSGNPVTVIMPIDAALDKILPAKKIKESVVKIRSGETLDPEKLITDLVSLGYERTSQVTVPGEFAVRGGIIDIFMLNDTEPARVEFFGDEVDSIRSFDADSQRSIENLDEIAVFPATEFLLSDEEMYAGFEKIRAEKEKTEKKLRKDIKPEEASYLSHTIEEAIENIEYSRGTARIDSFVNSFYDETVSILDYFDDDALVIFDEPVRLKEKCEAATLEFSEGMIGRLEKGQILPSQMDVIFDHKTLFLKAGQKRLLVLSSLDYGYSGIGVKEEYNIFVKGINNYLNGVTELAEDVGKYKNKKYCTVIITGSHSRGLRLVEELEERGITSVYSDDRNREILQGEVVVTHGMMHRGFEYPELRVAVLVEGDAFSSVKKKKRKKQKTGREILSLHELTYGDYVVHERSGLGIYRGIEKRENDKTELDYIKIEYGDGELFIPATGLEAIQKYADSDADKKPKINKLNSPEWRKTRNKVQKAVTELAENLVRLYAIRSSQPGFKFSPDSSWQREFEESFPYEETDDQLRAIEDTKRDMESDRIMDRLICGDVGYGKTEVALRAAFKAVQDGKQVVVMVPTTILAQQHYNTFKSRLSHYPVTVEMLSRFRTPAQQKETLRKLSMGAVDIVIGTHRVLSKDVVFKNLGLLIVDEEQRFGVTHKEKIKEMKKNVDVLTLTATPIPRTLHMSLAGIRDMSVLEEPPVDRLPIQTFVMEHNDEIIREAINREIARQGQVYFVYNRVHGIEDKASLIQELVPDAVVAYAHGQMSERELERIMYDFISGEIDVLVSTTIIETGLDISNVNTMIIDDADQMGLSQLYQLRGRVGRSARTSYAFLMYRRGKVLREIAEKRLQAIREFTDLGSGFKIAMRDLEIRGAGNVLGEEQSGHMGEVGYDLYCKMLDEAIRKAKGEEVTETEFDTVVKLQTNAFIPATYIKNETEKLDMYKRIAMIESEDDRMDITDELTDRYGEVPPTVSSLLLVAEIKAMAHNVYVTSLTRSGDVFKMFIYPKAPIKTELLDAFITAHKPLLNLTLGENPYMTYVLPGTREKLSSKKADERAFKLIMELLTEMKELF